MRLILSSVPLILWAVPIQLLSADAVRVSSLGQPLTLEVRPARLFCDRGLNDVLREVAEGEGDHCESEKAETVEPERGAEESGA